MTYSLTSKEKVITPGMGQQWRQLIIRKYASRETMLNHIQSSPRFSLFDPLSVLASLAFLAFLLQSIASLFDHSRSMASTRVTSRQFMELKMLTLVTQMLHALEKYVSSSTPKLNNDSLFLWLTLDKPLFRLEYYLFDDFDYTPYLNINICKFICL